MGSNFVTIYAALFCYERSNTVVFNGKHKVNDYCTVLNCMIYFLVGKNVLMNFALLFHPQNVPFFTTATTRS